MRSCLLFILFCVLSAPVLAEGEGGAVDIFSRKTFEEQKSPVADDIFNSEHKLKKRRIKKLKRRKDKHTNLIKSNVVMLQALNKVLGRISKFEAPLGIVSNFENIEIIARKCWKSPPSERPENSALLEIREVKAGEPPKQIFLGWMFSSSPGISALEHPVYDITVLSCEYRENLEVG